jgi:hypothetical protein
MDTLRFLSAALSEIGQYCIFAKKKVGAPIQIFYSSVGEALDAANKLDADGYDTYFALATFKDTTIPKPREATNALELRAFFLDLDCGEAKEYPTQALALRDLQRFCKELSLPKPTLVSSGRGIHAYWMLDTPISPEKWLPVATSLKQLCVQHELKADPTVTADAARILRIPGTHNYKDDPANEVVVLGEEIKTNTYETLLDLLGHLEPLVNPKSIFDVTYDPALLNDSTMSALMGNKESSFAKILKLTAKGRGCPQLGMIVKDSATLSEPLWRAGLSIIKHCSDAEKSAHIISKSHPDYDPIETIAKMQGAAGPYLCETFDDLQPSTCSTCKHYKKIKSPIVLGLMVVEAAAEDNEVVAPMTSNVYSIPQYPKPYVRGKHGGVYIRTTDDDGFPTEELVFEDDIYVIRRVWDSVDGASVAVRSHPSQDAAKEFTLPISSCTSREEFRKAISFQGIIPPKVERLMAYIHTWISKLKNETGETQSHRQFGWTDDTFSCFVVGKEELKANGVIDYNPANTATAALMPYFEPKGTLQGWKDAMKFHNRPGSELHQFIVGVGFGSILAPFTQHPNGILHLYSKTGFGKTTALYSAASVFGFPKELVLEGKDTDASRGNRTEIYHNFSLLLDEIANTDGKSLSNFALEVTGGKQRNRMKGSVNEERARGRPWELLGVTTGNNSLIDVISSFKTDASAEAQRVMEYRVPVVEFDSKEETDRFNEDILANYGHAGKVFVQYVIDHKDEVAKLIKDTQKYIDKAAGLKPQNRFMSSYGAAVMVALMIANKLGLIAYNIKVLMEWTIALLKQAVRNVTDLDLGVGEQLADYIYSNIGNIIKLRSTSDSRTGTIIPDKDPNFRIVARYETDTKKLFLLLQPLREWLVKQSIPYKSFTDELVSQLGAHKIKARINKGTNLVMPPSTVWVIDCVKLGIEITDETDEDKS